MRWEARSSTSRRFWGSLGFPWSLGGDTGRTAWRPRPESSSQRSRSEPSINRSAMPGPPGRTSSGTCSSHGCSISRRQPRSNRGAHPRQIGSKNGPPVSGLRQRTEAEAGQKKRTKIGERPTGSVLGRYRPRVGGEHPARQGRNTPRPGKQLSRDVEFGPFVETDVFGSVHRTRGPSLLPISTTHSTLGWLTSLECDPINKLSRIVKARARFPLCAVALESPSRAPDTAKRTRRSWPTRDGLVTRPRQQSGGERRVARTGKAGYLPTTRLR